VDLTRFTYTREARLFEDSDQTVKIRWYKCPPGAALLGVPTRINMGIWSGEPWRRIGIGEVYADRARWMSGDPPPSVTGTAPCVPDPAWWLNGQPYDPEQPPSPRDEYGVLMCCPRQLTGGTGGIMLQGEVEPIQYFDQAEGGVNLQGEVPGFFTPD
jgi:hypothetical protein